MRTGCCWFIPEWVLVAAWGWGLCFWLRFGLGFPRFPPLDGCRLRCARQGRRRRGFAGSGRSTLTRFAATAVGGYRETGQEWSGVANGPPKGANGNGNCAAFGRCPPHSGADRVACRGRSLARTEKRQRRPRSPQPCAHRVACRGRSCVPSDTRWRGWGSALWCWPWESQGVRNLRLGLSAASETPSSPVILLPEASSALNLLLVARSSLKRGPKPGPGAWRAAGGVRRHA